MEASSNNLENVCSLGARRYQPFASPNTWTLSTDKRLLRKVRHYENEFIGVMDYEYEQ